MALTLALGINIMSTFVHNEPTSLAIIQEAGLPEVFYQAIEIGIEPAIEVRGQPLFLFYWLSINIHSTRSFKQSQMPSAHYASMKPVKPSC